MVLLNQSTLLWHKWLPNMLFSIHWSQKTQKLQVNFSALWSISRQWLQGWEGPEREHQRLHCCIANKTRGMNSHLLQFGRDHLAVYNSRNIARILHRLLYAVEKHLSSQNIQDSKATNVANCPSSANQGSLFLQARIWDQGDIQGVSSNHQIPPSLVAGTSRED